MDGERNLKPKLAYKLIQDNFSPLIADGDNMVSLECPPPERGLYSFKGTLHVTLDGRHYTLDLELKHFLHRVSLIIHFFDNLKILFLGSSIKEFR